MSAPIGKEAFDREQAYIRSARSQTSVADAAYTRGSDSPKSEGLLLPTLSDSQCFTAIYDEIIQQMSGPEFKAAMDSAAAIERAVKRLRKRESALFETLKEDIRQSFSTLQGLNKAIAEQMARCLRQEAEAYSDADEALTKQWFAEFPPQGG